MTTQIRLRSSSDMSELAGESTHLILTGPPYFPDSLERTLKAVPESRSARRGIAEQLGHFAAALRPVFKDCIRVLSPGGACILQTRDIRLGDTLVPVAAIHRELLESAGLALFTRYWWIKVPQEPDRQFEAEQSGRYGRPRPVDPEEFLVFLKAGTRQPRMACTGDDLTALSTPLIKTELGTLSHPHRHMAPLPMCRLLVRAWSNPGELVVDPFAGHGTTLVAAHLEGREAIGYEVNPSALDAARRNLGFAP